MHISYFCTHILEHWKLSAYLSQCCVTSSPRLRFPIHKHHICYTTTGCTVMHSPTELIIHYAVDHKIFTNNAELINHDTANSFKMFPKVI